MMKRNIILIVISLMCSGMCHASDFEIKNGVNISHWLSQSSKRGEERAQYFTESDVKLLAKLGFDHLRLPIDEEQMFSLDGHPMADGFSLLHEALKWCKKYKMKAVVDLHILRSHNFNATEKPLFTDTVYQNRFYDLWQQISEQLSQYGTDFLAYEIMNEPVADDHQQWNDIANKCLQTIRKREPNRKVIIGSNRWQSVDTFKYLSIPDEDKNIILSFHFYEPFPLTHYQSSWTYLKNYKGPIHYPGILLSEKEFAQLDASQKEFQSICGSYSDKEMLEKMIVQAYTIAKNHKLQLYCGEFGCIKIAPEKDRLRWYSDIIDIFNKYDIARTCWCYKGAFTIMNDSKPNKKLIRTLMKQ